MRLSRLFIILLLLSPICAYASRDTTARHIVIDDIVVRAKPTAISPADKNGNVSINIHALHSLPRFGGAVDIISALKYTPGVMATQGGNNGLHVRGGDNGQCKILLGGAPIYSPSHLFGFFSVFNSAHLSGMTLYKSNVPAIYGHAASSVLDIRTHTYIPQKSRFEGNVGIIESDIASHIRINDRTAIYASARHSYASWLLSMINNQERTIKYEFGDFGLGLTTKIDKVGTLMFNAHFNRDITFLDVMMYDSRGTLNWWNMASSLSLSSPISQNVVLDNTLYLSIYDNKFDVSLVNNKLKIGSSVNDFGVRSVVSYKREDISVYAGMEYNYRNIRPQYVLSSFSSANIHTPFDSSHQFDIFVDSKWKLAQFIHADVGLRISTYCSDKLWLYPEPRIMLSFPITANSRLSVSYNMMTQYIHLAPQSNTSFATDFYVGACRELPPQRSHNFNIGYYQSVLFDRLHWSVEIYYRYLKGCVESMTNIVDMVSGKYKCKDQLFSGRGEAYGIETSIGYHDQKFSITANYTISRSLRQFDNFNQGRVFAAKSDRLHNISLYMSYEPSPRWTLSTTFQYATGAPYTNSMSVYFNNGSFLKEYGPYNGSRLPDLHHLDISVTYWFKSNKFERNGINVSLYNVYMRKNPLLLSWSVFKGEHPTQLYISERHNYLYTIIPSISWTFKF